MSLEKICRIIKNNDRFLISAHCEPEGDSLGSQLAMAEILKQMGKRFVIVNPDLPPKRYDFLKGIEQIGKPVSKTYDFDVALVLDCPTMERIGKVAGIIGKRPIVNIDHHISNKNFGLINYVKPEASSTGEVIYELAVNLGSKLKGELAGYLYLAILTDTGGFRYSNTTFETMRIASELLKFGVNPKQIHEKVYESHSLASRKLLGLCLNTLKVSGDGKISWMCLRKTMFKKTKAVPHDAENFVNYARFVKGVKAALFFSEVKKGFTKVSFRSNEPGLDVNKIAARFGGGGHVSASGCLIKGDIKTVQKKVIEEVRKVLKYYRNG